MPKRKGRYDVFLSYSHKDRALVKSLIDLLSVTGKVFWDEQLEPGDVWADRIGKVIAECKVVIVCCCCDSVDSRFVAEELRLALVHQKRIVPVRFCRAFTPGPLGSRQWIDLSGKVEHVCRPTEHVPVPDMGAKVMVLSQPSSARPGWPPNATAMLVVLATVLCTYSASWAYSLSHGVRGSFLVYAVFYAGLVPWTYVAFRWWQWCKRFMEFNRADALAATAYQYFWELANHPHPFQPPASPPSVSSSPPPSTE